NMSRFFRAGDNDSDDSESDYSEELSDDQLSDSDESGSETESEGSVVAKPVKHNPFMFGAPSDSDSDSDVGRTVVAKKDRRFEEIESAVNAMANGQKINDWIA